MPSELCQNSIVRPLKEVRLTPIFDTNIFGDVGGRISEKDWRFLVRHRPCHGWPLSDITAWELLVGVNVVKPSDFQDCGPNII